MQFRIKNYIHQWKQYKQELKSKHVFLYLLAELIELIVVIGPTVLVIKAYVIQSSLVFSGSMIPTMQVRDRLIVNKFIFHFKAPQRGDIILFDSPYKDGKEYVKRCIGLPGETVEIRDGQVFINQTAIFFPGVTILQDTTNYDPVQIPEGHYFALGDNRSNSADSRIWGFVPRTDLIGKAWFTFWPLNRAQTLR
tara:strand:- start:7393 stop:7974 length:582 start_codon:yes stop_codon:yes gene_type:complete